MNAIKQTKLTMALGAALVAGAMTANAQTQDADFNEFTRQARATVMAESTAQPAAGERVAQLRGALHGARVIAGLPSAEEQQSRAVAAIRAEQLADLRAAAPGQIAGSLRGARVVASLPSGEQNAREAIAAIQSEQLEDMRRNAGSQLAASMAGAHVMSSVAETGTVARSGLREWSMPDVEFKPLLDMSILHFSFRK